MADTRTKQLRYKRISLRNNHPSLGRILNGAIKDALRQPDKRIFDVFEGTHRLLNRNWNSNQIFIAELIQYETGKNPQSVKLKVDQDHYPVNVLKGLSQDEQLVDAAAYICLLGEHMLVMASQGFSVQMVESYLAWLVKEAKGDDLGLELQDLPGRKLSKLTENDDFVTSLVLGDRLRKHKKSVNLYDNFAWELLQFIAAKTKGAFQPDEMDEWNKVAANVTIHYARPDRKTAQRPNLINLLGSINKIPDDLVTAKTKKGKTLKGAELRLSLKIQVKISHGEIDFSSIIKPLCHAIKKAINLARGQ